MNFDEFLDTCPADNEIDKAIWFFNHGAALPKISPDLMRHYELGDAESGRRQHLLLTLLRALETDDPVGLHVSIPSKNSSPHCFFLGASVNTWAEMPDDKRVFFVDPNATPILERRHTYIHIAGDYDDRQAPIIAPTFNAVWTRREVGEPLRRPQLVRRADLTEATHD